MRKYFAFILLIFLFSGCALIDKAALKMGYEDKAKTELKIEELKRGHIEDVAIKTKEVEVKYDETLAQVRSNYQESSNWIYGASLASDMKFDKDRLDIVLDYRIKSAASYGLQPTREAMLEQQKLLKEELDATKVSNEELAKRYNAIQVEAEKAQDLAAKKDQELIAAKAEREEAEKKFNIELAALQTRLIAESNRIIALEKQRADDRAAIQKAKMKASFALGGLALLALAGAIYSPIAKDKCAIFAGILGLGAIGIWYIQSWHILLVAGLLILILIGFIVKKLYLTDKAATNTFRAIESIKTKNPLQYEQIIKPELSEYNTKYQKQDGKIIKIADKESIEYIDNKLMEVGDK